ncbi:MAG: TetR/AcrR family transcriptional regulator [Campylobacterota bacterium]|nr:TetR/AcrR family transcriptional regulator [Campylobacterota bacterium]
MKKSTTKEKLLDIAFEEVYIHGYAATSVDTILKKANITKGSMYHHFKSKKELVMAMIEERLFPKMDTFFLFEKVEGKSVLESIRNTYAGMAKNKPLITYGCPLYRLMVELSPVDDTFDVLLTSKVTDLRQKLSNLLQVGIECGEFNATLDTQAYADFILNATWGVLSLSPNLSSSKYFIQQSKLILNELNS